MPKFTLPDSAGEPDRRLLERLADVVRSAASAAKKARKSAHAEVAARRAVAYTASGHIRSSGIAAARATLKKHKKRLVTRS
jgi:hypothetical protein